MAWARARLFVVIGALSLFCVVPNESENYFPNNAYRAIQAFLADGIEEDTGSPPTEEGMRALWSFFVSIDIIGVVVGSYAVPLLTTRFGRPRAALLGVVALTVPGRALQLVSALPYRHLWPLLIVGKLLASSSIGVIESILPILLSEVAPAELRGRLAILLPMGICGGAILGAALGLDTVLGSAELWPYAYVVFGALILPAIPLLALLPDSPTQILFRGQGGEEVSEAKSAASLRFYQGDSDALEAAKSDAKLLAESSDSAGGLSAWWSVVREKAIRKQLLLALAIGSLYFPVVIIQSYSTVMLTDAGVPEATAEYATLGLKVVSFVEFILCIAIADRWGRRAQLFSGTIGIFLAFLLMALTLGLHVYVHEEGSTTAYSWAFLGSLFLLQISINFSIRPLYWVILPEIFPYRFRAAGKSLGNAASAVLCIVMNLIFYQLLFYVSFGAYIIASVPIFGALIYCVRNFPETSGRPLHEIFAEFEDQRRPILEAPTKDAEETDAEKEADSWDKAARYRSTSSLRIGLA